MTSESRNLLDDLIDSLSNLLNYAVKAHDGIGAEETVNPGKLLGLDYPQNARKYCYMQFEHELRNFVKMNPCLAMHNALELEGDETDPYRLANIIRNTAEKVAKENFEPFKNKLGLTNLTEEECKDFC